MRPGVAEARIRWPGPCGFISVGSVHPPASPHQPTGAGSSGLSLLLRNAGFTRPNQVWTADITYLPMAQGFLYLVVVMDWHSRYVVAWRLSSTLEACICAEGLGRGRPEVFV